MTGNLKNVNVIGAWLLGFLWLWPLLYAIWAAIHPIEYQVRFDIFAPLTLFNFKNAWAQAPFAQYMLNTLIYVTLTTSSQFVVCALAAFAFARFEFPLKNVLFGLVLIQLLIHPEVVLIENYKTIRFLGLMDTIPAISLPYIASAFGIFVLRQTFKTVPKALDDAALIDGANTLQILRHVYIPLSLPTFVAYGLVSISYHWNNYLWPLIVTNSDDSRVLNVGLAVFSMEEAGVEWATISAATLMVTAPLIIAFLIFQRQFIESFSTTGIK
ncbi:MAG TPA: ABC transporter permease [Rhodobiaceae bacterium]|jgi:sn-glycerol 3-phosphate transport system permease protein|nr:ABC transporter permease [Rhodobiaceae bacterium]|tara:strand:+ start:2700 stop:3509 length:810 start_codon:yes stop_codon:yes gene_type:complete